MGNAQQRVVEGALEMIGVPAFAIQAVGSSPYAYQAAPTPTICKACGGTGVHVNSIPPAHRAQLHPGWTFVCGRCGTGLR